MKEFALLAAAALLLGAASGSDNLVSPDPMAPHPSGVYILEDWLKPAKMLMIDAITIHQTRSRDSDKAFPASMPTTRFNSEIAGPHALIGTSEERPTFYFYFDAESRAFPDFFALIKFKVKKDRREAETGKFRFDSTKATVGMPFRYWQVKPSVYKVQPVQPLQKGEYGFLCLCSASKTDATASQVFDFSIQ
jgi:hypothetical protein